jgi:hypothetical protein
MAKLKAAQRNKLPSSEFAEPSKRKYPIDTRARARNALARASQAAKRGKLTPADKAMIVRKAHARLNYGKGKAN